MQLEKVNKSRLRRIKDYFTLFKTIRQHRKLSEKRHPALEQNKAGKFVLYFSAIISMLYLMFFAVLLALIVNESDSTTPCGMIYGLLPIILTVDFLFRFITQQTPSQLVKPYVLLPIPRMLCVDSFITTSLFNFGNITWFALFIPYTIMSVLFAEGIWVTLLFLLSLYILILINSQWYSIVRSLLNNNVLWWGLPLLVYAVIYSPWYLNKGMEFSSFADFYAEQGEALTRPTLISWLLLIAIFIFIIYVNRKIQFYSIWKELAKVEVTKLRHVSRFGFLDRYGLIGEYTKLEIKATLRNKNIRKTFIFANVFVLLISLVVAFTDIYDNQFMNFFWAVYCFAMYGAMILVRAMSAEGNYIDGLMIHRESILSLLTAKYYFFVAMLVWPFMLLIPTVIKGKYTLLMLISMALFTAGVQYFLFMQMAVYNKQSIPLNTKFIGKNNTENYSQVIIELIAFFVPIALLYLLYFLFSDTVAYITFACIGLIFVALHKLWLKNIYKRLMKRKYVNMEGFRSSR